METYNLSNDVKVFGIQVKTFPSGVAEAFHDLIKETGDESRSYYGISKFKDGKMVYYAAAEEKFAGEAEKYEYERFAIEKGDYLATTLDDWKSKTNCIKDIFSEIIKDPVVNKTKPAIEWYKDENEMMCLVKMKEDSE